MTNKSPNRYLTSRKKLIIGQILINIFLVIGIFLTLLPLLMTFYNSFKSKHDIEGNMWLPQIPFRTFNYTESFEDLLPYLKNTILVTIVGVSGMLIISSLASYAIAKIRFKGHKFVYALVLGLMMLPGVLTLVPAARLYAFLGLEDTLWALIFPIWSNGCLMTVFLMTSLFRSLPKEIFESAKIDGANEFRQYSKIAIPLAGPTIGTCVIIQIVSIWNDYLWPTTINTDPDFQERTWTLPAALLNLSKQADYSITTLYAGYIIAAIPLLLIFIFANKFYIEGLIGSSIKM